MEAPKKPGVYYVAFFVTAYQSFEEAKAQAPETIAAHLKRSQEFHAQGKRFVAGPAGAFLNTPGEPLGTMRVRTSREAAEEYAKGDPFVVNGMVTHWYIREWANMLA